MEEQQGLVYFKNVRAEDTRGNLTSGELLRDPRLIGKTPKGYASNQIFEEELGSSAGVSAGSTETLSGTVLNAPVTPQTLQIRLGEIGAVAAFGMDDGAGHILGSGLSGSVNYDTGAIEVTISAAVAAGAKLYVTYRTNFEAADDIPQVQSYYDSIQVQARVYALKSTLGMLQSYAMQKRFGVVAEDDIARDLIGEINAEIGGDLIRAADAVAPKIADWTEDYTTGEAWFIHKQSFADHLALLDQTIAANTGRGEANYYIAGSRAAAIMQTLPGFTKVSDGSAFGPQVFGTINGKTIIRVPEAAVLAPGRVIGVWKGSSPFEASLVYAPFMP